MNGAAKILLVGCGKMGAALLQGWVASGFLPENIKIIDPNATNLAHGIEVFADANLTNFEPDFVVLAVKPQIAEAVLPQLGKFRRAIFVSIMAGKKLLWLSEKLLSMEVVRAMPNLPATIGRGFTALFAPKQIRSEKLAEIAALFAASGEVAWLENEAQLDALTAISGSGPAYVFLFAEIMTQFGIEQGLAPDLAKQAALATISGAAELAKISEISLTELKNSVTSKGGTTEAALEVLENADTLANLLKTAMLAALKKSQSLA